MNNKVDRNVYVKSKTHEISNRSMHISWGPQPGRMDKCGDERKGYNIHVRLNGLAMDNSIIMRDKVNQLMK